MFKRKFKLRFVVNNFSVLKDEYSENKEHYGVPWRISVDKSKDSEVGVYLHCENTKSGDPWSIDTSFDFSFPTVTGVKLAPSVDLSYNYQKRIGHGRKNIHSNENVLKAIRDDTFIVDCDVTILSMKGIPLKRFMSFDEPDEDLTDVVVEVGAKKFHLSKEVLATYSTYFKSLFFGGISDPEMSTASLGDEDPEDFHSLIEIIAGYKALNDDNVVGVLKLARQLDVEKVLYRCELCLIGSTRFEKDMKVWLGDKFQLEELLYHVYDNIKSMNDWKACMPSNAHALSQRTLALFHDKIFEL